MITLCCENPGLLRYHQVPLPEVPPGHALIKIKRVGICGTDLHAYEGTQPYFEYPRVLGHEIAGEVVDVNGGTVSVFSDNRKCCIIPYFSCGNCIACCSGKTNCCSNLKVAGVHIDGGMAEYYCVPIPFIICNEELSLDMLCVVEPFAIGAHAISRAGIRPSEFVLVMGLGPIGLAVSQSAMNAGARVIGMDINSSRIRKASELMPGSTMLDANDPCLFTQIQNITSCEMFSVVIDATGNRQVINYGINYLAHGGRYVLVGLQKGDLLFSHPEFHKREATLMSSRNATKDDFQNVIAAIKNGDLNVSSYITHKVQFAEVAKKFPTLSNPNSGVIKAIVEI